MSFIYYQCVRHIDTVDPNDIGPISFDYDGVQKWLCSPWPLNFAFADSTPITTAYVIGQISNAKTIQKVGGRNGNIKRVIFWVENHPDRASRTLWGQIPRSLGLILGASESFLSFSHLFEVNKDSGVMRLRVVWAPEPSGTEFPAFAKGYQEDISALCYGQAVQVLFHVVHGDLKHGKADLEASLLTVTTV